MMRKFEKLEDDEDEDNYYYERSSFDNNHDFSQSSSFFSNNSEDSNFNSKKTKNSENIFNFFQQSRDFKKQLRDFYKLFLDSHSQSKGTENFLNCISQKNMLKILSRKVKRPDFMQIKLEESGKYIFFGDIHGRAHILSFLKDFLDNCQLLNPFDKAFNMHSQFRRKTGRIMRNTFGTCGMGDMDDEDMPTLIFIGDYVDRSPFSAEVYCLLVFVESLFPNNFILLRGNHEGPDFSINQRYGSDWLERVGDEVTDKMRRCFEKMPCLLQMVHFEDEAFKIGVVHGGVGPNLGNYLKPQFLNNTRFKCPHQVMQNLLWSDPLLETNNRLYRNFKSTKNNFLENRKRNIGTLYSLPDIQKNFQILFRAHTFYKEGFKIDKKSEDNDQNNERKAHLLSIFSSMNYMGNYENHGAFYFLDVLPSKTRRSEVRGFSESHMMKKEDLSRKRFEDKIVVCNAYTGKYEISKEHLF